MMLSKEELNKTEQKNLSEENLHYFIEDPFEYFNHYDIESYPEIIWKRPREIIDDPCLLEVYGDEIDGYSTCGSESPDWFPVLIILLKSKNLLNLVIQNIKKQDNFNNPLYKGSFEFCFFGKNTWNKIIIDDRLPFIVDGNKNLFCISSNKEEFLPPLLEKAYARYLGGYGKLKSIDFTEALMNFSGGIIEHIELGRNLHALTYQDQKTLYKRIKALTTDTVIVCDTTERKNESETETGRRTIKFLLPRNHYYLMTGFTAIPPQSNLNIVGTVLSSILDINTQDNVDMLRLHNPLLNGDWNGAYSVGSPEWEAINENIRRHFNLNFNHEFEFWMTMDDLTRNMSNMILCHIPSQSFVDKFLKNVVVWYNFYQRGNYSSNIPGGSIIVLENDFLKNDQYAIDVSCSNPVDVKLVLSMESTDQSIRFNNGCGIVLLKVENNRSFRLHDINNSEILNFNTLSKNGNTFSAYVKLTKGRYVLIPFRKESIDIEYYIRLYTSQKSVTVSSLREDKPALVQCLKCNLVKTLIKTKDIITNLSRTCENTDKLLVRNNCPSCISINPEIAVRMTIVGVSGLDCNDDKSHINSYFILKFSNYTYRSITKLLTANPNWNDSFVLYKTAKQRDDLTVEVFSEQKIGFDKSLGIHLFTETELIREEVVANLSIPVNKEWVHTKSKIIVKFKMYLPKLFDTI